MCTQECFHPVESNKCAHTYAFIWLSQHMYPVAPFPAVQFSLNYEEIVWTYRFADEQENVLSTTVIGSRRPTRR